VVPSRAELLGLRQTAGDPMRMVPVLRREALALNPDAVFTTQLLADANAGSLYALNVAASR